MFEIRPLKWQRGDSHSYCCAYGVEGWYRIHRWVSDGRRKVSFTTHFHTSSLECKRFTTIEKAKQHCERHFKKQVRRFLKKGKTK